jgi:hypothetical protein
MYGFFPKGTDPPHHPYSSDFPSLPSCLRLPPSPTHSGRRLLGHTAFAVLAVLFGSPTTLPVLLSHAPHPRLYKVPFQTGPSWCSFRKRRLTGQSLPLLVGWLEVLIERSSRPFCTMNTGFSRGFRHADDHVSKTKPSNTLGAAESKTGRTKKEEVQARSLQSTFRRSGLLSVSYRLSPGTANSGQTAPRVLPPSAATRSRFNLPASRCSCCAVRFSPSDEQH